MAEGIISNLQMSLDAKVHTAYSPICDLSTAHTSTTTALRLLYSRDRDIAIQSIDFNYVTEAAAAASTISVGTLASLTNVVAAVATSATGDPASTAATALTLATTLQQAGRYPALSRPILPKNTVLVLTNTASGGAGEIQLAIVYYFLDRQTTNA